MKQKKNLKISFAEMSLIGRQILAKQSATSYEDALCQVQRLKQNSKVIPTQKKDKLKN